MHHQALPVAMSNDALLSPPPPQGTCCDSIAPHCTPASTWRTLPQQPLFEASSRRQQPCVPQQALAVRLSCWQRSLLSRQASAARHHALPAPECSTVHLLWGHPNNRVTFAPTGTCCGSFWRQHILLFWQASAAGHAHILLQKALAVEPSRWKHIVLPQQAPVVGPSRGQRTVLPWQAPAVEVPASSLWGTAPRSLTIRFKPVSVFAAVLLQLGAVCGSEGDCCRRLDDLARAEQHYLAGVEHMQTCER